MVFEITERTDQTVAGADGRVFLLESVTVQCGEAHQLWMSFCDGWLVAYQVVPLPGFSFEPISVAALVADYYARRVKPKPPEGGSESE